ncbi:MAG: hypothetical protein ACI4XF_11520 [Oscillospiraceae bacterium]
MAEIKDEEYSTILDEEDYAEILENSADIPISDKQLPTHNSDSFHKGEKTVRIISVIMIAVASADMVLWILSRSLIFGIISAAGAAVTVFACIKMWSGKVYARYMAIIAAIIPIVLCVCRMIGLPGSGRGTAAVLIICFIGGAAELVSMLILISDKNVNGFFNFHNRMDRLHAASEKRKRLDSLGKRFK